MTLPHIKLVIFDCDGVLVDSELLSARMMVQVFAEIGITVDLPFVYRTFVGHSFTSVARQFALEHGKNVPANFVDDYRKRLLDSFTQNLKAVAGIEQILDHLAVPYCLASGSSPARVAHSLSTTNLASRFQGRVFTTSMVARGKPAPDIFLHVANTYAVAPEHCLAIEDSTPGVESAAAAGMTVWQFVGGSHFQFGYERVPPPQQAHRRFAAMAEFFSAAPHLEKPH